MLRKLTISFLVISFLFLLFPLFYLFNQAQMITQSKVISNDDQKISYNLPYPGILPDHPLYALKTIRDRIVEFTSRDNLKKSHYYLLLSDKHVSMALILAQKGKPNLAITTLLKGEKYFEKIPPTLKTSKEQGVGASEELIMKLKLSNQKHYEVIQDMMSEFTPTERVPLQEVLTLNQNIEKQLRKL